MQEKKKILFVITDLSQGGAEKVLLSFLKHLNQERYEIDLCLIYKQGVYLRDIPPGVNVYALAASRIYIALFSRILNNLVRKNNTKFLSWYINRRIKKSYDIVVPFLEGLSTRCASLIKFQGTKISWVHCDLFNNHWTANAYRDIMQEQRAYLQMDHIVFVSAESQRQFNRLFEEMDISRQKVIQNLIDRDEIRRKSEEWIPRKDKTTLCLVGRLIPVKGLERFFVVVERLVNEGFDFDVWVLGDGLQESSLKETAISKNLQEVISFEGFQKNSYPYVKAVDLFLNVSFSEGSPLSIAEALCLHTPVMATRTAGSEELLREGKFGMLVENSEEGIYQGLKAFLEDKEVYKKLREKAMEGSLQFEIAKTMERVDKLFMDVLVNINKDKITG